MPRQWNNQENIDTWRTHQGKGQGGNMQATGVFHATSKGVQVYNLIQHRQEREYVIYQGRDGRHKIQNTAIQCLSNLWQSSCKNIQHLIPKSTGRRKQENKIFARIWGKLIWYKGHVHASHFGKMDKPKLLVLSCTGKRIGLTICSPCMHSDCPGMYYIWWHGAADIQIPATVGSKQNMDNWNQINGDANICYEEARHLVGASQGGVSESMENLPSQESNVKKTRFRINLWEAIQEEKWWHVPKFFLRK